MAGLVTVSTNSQFGEWALIKGWWETFAWDLRNLLFLCFSNKINHWISLHFWLCTQRKLACRGFTFILLSLSLSAGLHSTDTYLSHTMLNISPITTEIEKHVNTAAQIGSINSCLALKADSFVDLNGPVQNRPTCTGSVCEVQRLHLIWMRGDSWASCPVLPRDCRNAKWSGLEISFPSSSFLLPLPLFLLPPGDPARLKRRRAVYMSVYASEGGGVGRQLQSWTSFPPANSTRVQITAL